MTHNTFLIIVLDAADHLAISTLARHYFWSETPAMGAIWVDEGLLKVRFANAGLQAIC